MFAQCLIYIVFSSLVSFFSFYLVWYFLLKRNKILNTYMQFLCESMKIDCEIDCNARGCRLRSCLEHQISQGQHCYRAKGGCWSEIDWSHSQSVMGFKKLPLRIWTVRDWSRSNNGIPRLLAIAEQIKFLSEPESMRAWRVWDCSPWNSKTGR